MSSDGLLLPFKRRLEVGLEDDEFRHGMVQCLLPQIFGHCGFPLRNDQASLSSDPPERPVAGGCAIQLPDRRLSDKNLLSDGVSIEGNGFVKKPPRSYHKLLEAWCTDLPKPCPHNPPLKIEGMRLVNLPVRTS